MTRIAKNVQLCYQYWGSGISLGVGGTYDEVVKFTNRLYNHGAVDGDLIWMNERPQQSFGYVITTKEKLRKGFESIYLTGERMKRFASIKLQSIPMRNRMKTVARLKSEMLFAKTGADEDGNVESLEKRLTGILPKIPLVNFLGLENKEDTIFTPTINGNNSENED